jgi:TetR/AcrR family transcriptional regulator, copper-responsive repressor
MIMAANPSSRVFSEPVQKTSVPTRKRGRPRAYNPDEALQRALRVFWRHGYARTSLDDIVAATGMNRPSLYAAFGDKRSLYLKSLAHYHTITGEALRRALSGTDPLRATLMRVYEAAITLYLSGDQALGCFAVGTATTEAAEDPEVRAMLAESTRRLDQAFEARIIAARDAEELPPDTDTVALASLASATLHTIAIRARAGIPRDELLDLARRAVAVICPCQAGVNAP